jgi:hypothetical protein
MGRDNDNYERAVETASNASWQLLNIYIYIKCWALVYSHLFNFLCLSDWCRYDLSSFALGFIYIP